MNENDLLRAILSLCQQWVTNTSGGPPVNTVAPVLTCDGDTTHPTPSQIANSTTGTWTNSPTGYVYSFKWEDNTVLQSGASDNYVVQNSDVGHQIHCTVTASNGSGSGSANSNSSGTVGTPPTNFGLPLIDNNSPQENETLYATQGSWSGSPTFTYQWYINSVQSIGATGLSFNVGLNAGNPVDFSVTATESGYSATVFSGNTNNIASAGTGPCVLKLYADNISGVVTDPVATWPDKSGNGNDATQGTPANQPVLAAGPNGKLAALFDGVDDFLATAALGINRPVTVFCVLNPLTSGTPQYYLDGSTGDAASITQVVTAGTIGMTGGTAYISGTYPAGFFLFGSIDSSTGHVWFNGSLQASGDPGSNNPNGFVMGKFGVGGTAFANCKISAVMIFIGSLSDANRQAVEAFFAAYYGL